MRPIPEIALTALLLTWCLTIRGVLATPGNAATLATQVPFLQGGRPINVAVIGAGAAGSSSAFHLAKYAQRYNIPLNITVFERNSYIGGRSVTVNAHNNPGLPIELGASIFVQANKILVDAAKELNLTTSSPTKHDAPTKPPGAQIGVWDGEQFHVTFSGSWLDLAKMFWRYGYAPIRTQNLMKKTVDKFLGMYEEPIFPFESLTQAAQDVGLLAVTAATGEQYMRENRIAGPFGRDVVQASTRVNYAQNLAHIHGLEAMVCMATDGAMQVEGGNWQIFDQMVKASHATVLLSTQVNAIQRTDDGLWALEYASSPSIAAASVKASSQVQLFDSVIVAGPYQFSNITSQGLATLPDEVPYVSLHVTLFASPHLLSPRFFNLATGKPVPLAVLTTLPPDEHPHRGAESVGSPGFFSISLLQSIINPDTGAQEYLYKIFSPAPSSPTFLASILGVVDLPGNSADEISERDVSWLYRKVWRSYPYEYPRVTFEEIELGANLWYTGGMESFISTMETNALMGKNVAKLLVERERMKAGKGTPEE